MDHSTNRFITNYDWATDMIAFRNGERQGLDHYNSYPHFCYKRFEETMTFNDAKAKCEDEGATLMEPNWPPESWTVLKVIYDEFVYDPAGYWIGIQNDGESET